MIGLLNGTGQPLSAYAICVAAGFVAALLSILYDARRQDLDREDCAYIYVCGMLGMAVGAKLLYLLVSYRELAASMKLLVTEPLVWYRVWMSGGFVFYGGLFGMLLGTRLAARYFHKEWKAYVSVFVPAMCLFHIFGRIGCYFAGCCYGIKGIPVQLIEAGAVLFFLMYLRVKRPVRPLEQYLTCYAVLRFLLEFLRGDAARGFIGLFSVSQWISAGILCWLILAQIHRKTAD